MKSGVCVLNTFLSPQHSESSELGPSWSGSCLYRYLCHCPHPHCSAQQYQLAENTRNLHLCFLPVLLPTQKALLSCVPSGTVPPKHPGQRASAAGSFLFTPRMTPYGALAVPSTLSMYFTCLPLLHSFALPIFLLLLVCGNGRR